LTGPVFRQLWIACIVLGVAAVVVVSLLPIPARELEGGSDKFWHFLTYFVLALFSAGIVPAERLWRLALRCLLLGACLEAAQALLTETRQADWADMAANAAGILCAWVIASGGRAGWARHVESWLAHRGER
jgi:VanZ family protein